MNYFKEPDLNLLFASLKEKYIKKSKLTGTISIIPNEAEANKIGRFLGLNLKANTKNIIKITQIEIALKKSKFENLTILEILNYIYGNIVTKEQKEQTKEQINSKLLKELLATFANTSLCENIKENLKNPLYYKKVIYLLNNNKSLLYNIFKAIINLPTIKAEYINLSIFASQITNDPHYFDLETTNNREFLWFSSYYLNLEFANTRKRKLEILNMLGLYTDNVSNFVITYNFYGSVYLDYLAQNNEPVLLSLNNIEKLSNIYALNKKVIILENPSILNLIMLKKHRCAFIITSGNTNIACYKLLDKLNNHIFYYNGDYDPEGLLIADKLKRKYLNLNLIGYDNNLYIKAKSNKIISSSRLKKLNTITAEELQEIKENLLKTNNPGYQEKIVNELLAIISNLNDC